LYTKPEWVRQISLLGLVTSQLVLYVGLGAASGYGINFFLGLALKKIFMVVGALAGMVLAFIQIVKTTKKLSQDVSNER
jgi:F0F1-type ATP synthase assembly protein I